MKLKISRILEFLALKKSMLALLSMVVFVGLGEKISERYLPLYLIALGGSPIVIGLLNGLDNLLSALYSYPGGWLADKIGYKRALLVFNLFAMLGYLIVILFPHWLAVLIGALFFLSWSAISMPATMSMVSAVLPSNKHTMGVSMISMIRRIPMALGPVMGGFFIARFGSVQGIRYAFACAIVFALLAIVIQQRYIEDKRPEQKEFRPRTKVVFSKKLKNLLVSDILVRYCEQIPEAFVVVWVVSNHGLSTIQFGVLSAIEMVTALLIYIPVAYLADSKSKKPFIAITLVNFTMFPIMLYFCSSFATFVVAFIIRGLKEFGEPTRKALILELASQGSEARTFGTYYLIRDVIVSIAAFGGAFLWMQSPGLNFLIAAIFGTLSVFYFLINVK
jgi:MFS family permease